MTAQQTITWDEQAIAQAKAQEYLESGLAATDKEAFEMSITDGELMEFEYDDFLEDFTAILKHISKDGLFYVEGRNMGWRHRSGHLGLEADNARAFIDKAFPGTSEWTLRGEYDRRSKTLTYTLSHHDAPTGEFYTVRRGHKHRSGDIEAERERRRG
ncbi:MAG: hypothetical protein V1721_03545 [Pseudomonadota bacterium]